jgi:hypothetical protein
VNEHLPTARVAFLRGALTQRDDVDLVEPWTKLSSMRAGNVAGTPEVLFVELDRHVLTPPLRALLAAATGLRIIALSPDGSAATVFGMIEQRTSLAQLSADELVDLFGPDRDLNPN